MNKKNVLYVGIELDKESQDILRSHLHISEDWKIKCRHMTIFYNRKRLQEIPLKKYEEEWVDKNLGKEITLVGYEIWVSKNMMILQVMSRAPKNTYIPLATKKGESGGIKRIPIYPIILTGRVYVWYI